MKKHSKAKLKGTVLFTVISVMSLLIIFLTSTLVLATSASNRSHKNYAATQTEYTARAAIESFSEAMSRSDAVAQMIVNMKKTDVLTPSVEINDSALGEIGYYDNSGNWNSGQISIEYIDDTYVYNTEKSAWEEQQVLKVTATAELGGEESTVCAYIRKKSPDEPNPISIKGLQTAGGLTPDTTQGTYTGALALGVTADGTGEYQLNNGTIVKTDLTFVNGSLKTVGNLNFDIENSGTGTVILKDLEFSNPVNINLKYEMTGDFVQKDIPYLFVNGQIINYAGGSTFINVNNSNGKKSPYNIFCGSFNSNFSPASLDCTDLYLMDPGVTSKIGGPGNTKLSAWNNSLNQKSETQFDSKGGNIYSKGNVELENVTIDGDVRVEGDVTIKNGVNITGNLVVGGTLNLNAPFNIGKNIYADSYNGFSPQLKPGYTKIEKNNIWHPPVTSVDPKYQKIDNIHYDYDTNNYEVYESNTPGVWGGWVDRNGDTRNSKITYYDEFGNCYEKDQWYPGLWFNDDEISRGYLKDKFDNVYHYNPWNPHQYDGGYYVTADQYGNEISTVPTNKPYYYYDTTDPTSPPVEVDESVINVTSPPYYTQRNCDGDDHNPNSGSDTGMVVTDFKTIYYKDSAGNIVNATEAYTGVYPVSDFTSAKGSIYPDTMTREAITGKDAGGNPYPDSKQEYKFVTTLDEIKKSIGYIGSNFDPSIYLTDIPSGIDVSTVYDLSSLTVTQGGVTTNLPSSDPSVIDITNSCTIKGDNGSGHSVNIRIKPTGTIWVKLDNVTLQRNSKIVVDDSHGAVNFLVNGHLLVRNSSILTKKIDDGNLNITDTDKIGITFYGTQTPESEIEYDNLDTICGTAKCPYTKLNIANNAGALSGVTYNGKPIANPHWIGNALFKEIGNSGDNFTLVYTDAGGSADSTITNQLLSESWEIMYYDMY